MKITGLMVYYYFVCHKKLWYHLKNLNLENESENVGIGKLLDETTYSKENKHISIDNVINIDFIKRWEILHDIKKSKSIEEAGIWQMKYYIYYLEKKGILIKKGMIDYPLLKQRKEVELSDDDRKIIEQVLVEIEEIGKKEKAPDNINSKICKKCAFYEFCYC
ncbi:CRISPR-associated protein Cas4 [Peptostreptococcus canis]|uniref:CRISPR-associated exonuclease Cas4 n=1 Tax=Peptostreptococcus canis TaxID=1159213 RepID=A0ABR6TMW5_9FIRM|nr:CRISPR-associated protein Cas4 [Peptostreptococcus canis]MBC2576296.1 CRISPR-associated protein Cas4 [Peptostreptococcus canis]MBP1998494.1 CRISPR-associated exonuclease Cas4 [Peptostreptococcus canis]